MKKFTFKNYLLKVFIIYFSIVIISFLLFGLDSYEELAAVALISLFFLFVLLVYCFRVIFSIKKQDKIELEKDISSSRLKYKGWYFTNKYIFSIRDLIKIKYDDILVVESKKHLNIIKPIFNLDFIYDFNIYSKSLLVYLKDGSIVEISTNYFSNISEDMKKIIDLYNPRVYYGKYKDYKKIH